MNFIKVGIFLWSYVLLRMLSCLQELSIAAKLNIMLQPKFEFEIVLQALRVSIFISIQKMVGDTSH